MFKVRIDEKTELMVDFGGLLTPREEEVTALRFLGKNKGAVSIITGTATDTVGKQVKRVYQKTDVDGTDNPLAVLMCKAFHNGWAKFVSVGLIVICLSPMIRVNARSTSVSRSRQNDYPQVMA
jgi:DNA-binding CsgD family transcriptional regulator